MAALIREGHSRVFEYGYDFITTCIDDLQEHNDDLMKMHATSTRLAGASNEEWKKFIGAGAKKEAKKAMTKQDHLAMIAKVKRLG